MMDAETAEGLDDEIDALETSLGAAADMAAGFEGELRRVQKALDETGRGIKLLEAGLSRGLKRAIDGAVFDGRSLSDALETVAQAMVNTTYNAAVRPVTDRVGGLLAKGIDGIFGGLLPFEKGGAFTQGRVMPFANGGVVSGPVTFPMRGGMGLMGEAGPEAILPLARGADGRLGVRSAGGGGPVNVVMNVTTPDVEGFRRSSGQIAAQVSRALGRGARNR